MKSNRSFTFFPKDQKVNLPSTIILWLLFGTFGVHQFYLGNKKKGLYFLLTTGISNFLVIIAMSFKINWPLELWFKIYIGLIVFCAILGVPVYLLEPFTMVSQVRKANGDVNVL